MGATRLHPPAIDTAWQDDAACRDMDRELFYRDHGLTPVAIVTHTCAACPVRQTCLDTALAQKPWDDHGIWAGTTPTQRRDIRRARNRRTA